MMRGRILETGIALLLAFGYAGVANLLLGRRARTPFEWTQSFLIGCGVCSALLFPFSAFFGGWALRLCLAIVASGALVEALRLAREARPQAPRRASELAAALRTPLGAGAAAVVAASFLAFVALNSWFGLMWDGMQIWATKAQILYATGRVGPDPMPPEMEYLHRLVNYPHAIPLYEALLELLRGSFDFLAVKPIFPLFYLCLLIATWRGARALMPPAWAFAATAVLAALPGVPMMGENFGAYADLPLAAAMMTAWAGCLPIDPGAWRWRSPAVWSLGALLFFKSEGVVLLVISLVVLLALHAARSPRAILRAGLPIVLLAILRFGYVQWVAFQDGTYAPINLETTRRAIARLPIVALVCGKHLFTEPGSWGVFWAAFALLALWLLRRGTIEEKGLALTGLLGVVAYAGIFLYTNWRPEVQIPNAFPRLLVHIAPIAAVVVVAGYRRAFHSKSDSLL